MVDQKGCLETGFDAPDHEIMGRWVIPAMGPIVPRSVSLNQAKAAGLCFKLCFTHRSILFAF
jgi:hypothetical protein